MPQSQKDLEALAKLGSNFTLPEYPKVLTKNRLQVLIKKAEMKVRDQAILIKKAKDIGAGEQFIREATVHLIRKQARVDLLRELLAEEF